MIANIHFTGDMAQWYLVLKSNAKPLKHMCRCAIRRFLPDQKNSDKLLEATEELPLPLVHKEYLRVKLL